MNLIQVPMVGRFFHELPDAVVQGAVEQQIRAGCPGAPLVVKRGPFPKDSGRAKIDVGGRTSRARVVNSHFPFTFSPSSTSRRLAQCADIDNQLRPEPAKLGRTIPQWLGVGSRTHG